VWAGDKQVPSAPPKPAAPSDFRVGPGDVLRIDVWKEQEVSTEVVVRPDGVVSLPLTKDIKVDGMTPLEIEKLVTEKLSKFLAAPDVTVVVKQINSKKIYMVGQVHKVGSIPLLAPMTVAQALSEAGGPTEYANTKQIVVIREQGGKAQRFRFNYKDFLKGQETGQNIPLIPGDTVVVP
jgi:polysaccharide export outer membrane protein